MDDNFLIYVEDGINSKLFTTYFHKVFNPCVQKKYYSYMQFFESLKIPQNIK